MWNERKHGATPEIEISKKNTHREKKHLKKCIKHVYDCAGEHE